jgi:hypothetical protein
MRYLKFQTPVTLRIGPFLDITDGVTEEESLAGGGIERAREGEAFAPRSDTTATVHDAEGWYSCVLNATDTGLVGSLIVKAHSVGTHLPVWHEFMVLPAVSYDTLVLGTDIFDVNVTAMAADVLTETAIEADAITAGKIANGAIDADTFVAGAINSTVIGDNAIGNSKIEDGAISYLKFASDAIDARAIAENAIGSSEMATTAVSEIADQVWDELISGHVIAGSFAEYFGTHEEASSGPPAATASIADMLHWMFTLSRNRLLQTDSLQTIRNSANSGDIATAAVSDDAGTFERSEWTT